MNNMFNSIKNDPGWGLATWLRRKLRCLDERELRLSMCGVFDPETKTPRRSPSPVAVRISGLLDALQEGGQP